MRRSSTLLLALCSACLLCSCSQKSPEVSLGAGGPERALGTRGALGEIRGSPTVDSTFMVIEDLTADGEPDSLEFRVLGPSMDDPFRWTVRIWVHGDLVFEHEAVDSLIDPHFGDPEAWGGSGSFGLTGNREQDKAYYYFEDIPRRIVGETRFEGGWGGFDRRSPAGVYRTLVRELPERGVQDEETIRRIVERVEERLRTGVVVLSIPVSPARSDYPLIYIAELREFVPFVTW